MKHTQERVDVYLREKVFEHAEFSRLATVIKLINLVNKERL